LRNREGSTKWKLSGVIVLYINYLFDDFYEILKVTEVRGYSDNEGILDSFEKYD
jgi:hypothetical protein